MTLAEANAFISETQIDASKKSVWADLGCGNGLFTKALAARLHNESIIYAVDQSYQNIQPPPGHHVQIIFRQKDFIKDELESKDINGILMANSFHYVKYKNAFLQSIKKHLLPTAGFIVIEYDTIKANHWVPYPISFVELEKLFEQEGYSHIKKTGERKSIYQMNRMYIAEIKP